MIWASFRRLPGGSDTWAQFLDEKKSGNGSILCMWEVQENSDVDLVRDLDENLKNFQKSVNYSP